MEDQELKRLVLTPQETSEDQVVSISLRPNSLNDFIGQGDLKEALRVAIAAAQKRQEPLEHILFSGPPGLGKTSLAHIIAHEMKGRITITSGPSITRAGDLIGILTNLEAGDILFIDEIHRLSKQVEEFLYPAMENFKIDFVVDKGPYARTINFNLKPFTLIGATTRSGLLTTPLRDRFGLLFHLNFYTHEDLATIIKRSALTLGVSIDPTVALSIASRSRGTPRIANRLLRRCRDYAHVAGVDHIDEKIIQQAFRALHIDDLGLDELDRRMLKTMLNHYRGGPVGLETLSATLNEESDTIMDVVEPFLLKEGLIRRTNRGRELTDRARSYLQTIEES